MSTENGTIHFPSSRSMTDEEKAKYRAWQTQEILRRRAAPGLEEKPRAEAESPTGNCPECGTPYPPNRKRCYRCKPGVRKGQRHSNSEPKPAPPVVARVKSVAVREAVAVPAPVPAPVAALVPAAAPIVSVDLPNAVTALRAIVDLLAGLDDDSARWLVDSAWTLSRKASQHV